MFYQTIACQQSPVNKLGTKHLVFRAWVLSSNLIGQNGYLGGKRILRDSGSQFYTNCFFMNRPVRLDVVIAKCLPFCTQNFKSKFASLKIERLILCTPLNTIENGIGEKF